MIPRFRSFVAPVVLALGIVAAACTGGDGDPPATSTGAAAPSGVDPSSLVVQVASADLYAGEPQRVDVGISASSPDGGIFLVTAGEIEVALAPFEDGPGTPVDGTGRYLPAPGTATAAAGPTLAPPAEARGVYEVADVTFDAAGIWEATVTFSVDGSGPFEVGSTPFNVLETPAYPAPGDQALETENLTLRSDVPVEAIDSGAITTGEIPDPELHEWTIADALAEHRPIVAIFSTPAHCESLFCGPVTDSVQDLAVEYADKAVFVHVEIYREYDPEAQRIVINQAAADWLYRNDNLTEPWLYLIDDRGRIADRWGPLFDPGEVAAMLRAMPDMPR